MVKELLSLLTRLVVALETMANTEKTITVVNQEDDQSAPQTGATGDGVVATKDYEKVSKMKEGRKALFDLCAARNIEGVTPQTRTNTLIAKLNAWDMANPEPQTGQEPDPFADNASADEDPFAENTDAYTVDDVRVALQSWMQNDRTTVDVVNLLKEHGGGVERFADLKAEFYPTVMKAIHG